jgi:hypothetical protein
LSEGTKRKKCSTCKLAEICDSVFKCEECGEETCERCENFLKQAVEKLPKECVERWRERLRETRVIRMKRVKKTIRKILDE